MINKEQAQNIKDHLVDILVYNQQVEISAAQLKEASDPNVKALWRYSHESATVNAEKAGTAFLSYIDSLTEDDWIIWFGGDCPVEPDILVEYRTCSDGQEIQPAYNLRWNWLGKPSPRGGDITAYRVVG